MNNDIETPINKGVELMLRRVAKEPKKYGLQILKEFTLHRKQFLFKFEFTWRNLT
jgi:hypothetical protein